MTENTHLAEARHWTMSAHSNLEMLETMIASLDIDSSVAKSMLESKIAHIKRNLDYAMAGVVNAENVLAHA